MVRLKKKIKFLVVELELISRITKLIYSYVIELVKAVFNQDIPDSYCIAYFLLLGKKDKLKNKNQKHPKNKQNPD